MSILERIWADNLYNIYFKTPYEKIKTLELLLEYGGPMPTTYSGFGSTYMELREYEKAVHYFEKEMEIYDKWDSRPRWVNCYTSLGIAYHLTGQYKKERELYNKAEQDFPGSPSLLYRQAVLALTAENANEANRYIENYISIQEERSISEAGILINLGNIYSDAGINDKAEEYYRKALSLEPENHQVLNYLAYFLYQNNMNIDEGIQLIDKAMELNPDHYLYLATKGELLYKQGKYKEALTYLEKSWDLMPRNYDHDIYLHIEAVKKALAGN